jgi:osmotically-inducible protein OsmY
MVRSEMGLIELDHDLERRVINYLAQQHFPQLHAVEVRAQQGVVTIQGRVSSFYERQLCIHCCQRVAGVVRLNDQIEVGLRRVENTRRRPVALAVS